MKKKKMIKRIKKTENRKPKTENRKKGRCEEILCAGFGGQGIMFMGKLLAQAGLLAGKHVTWMPSYGAEVRGGTSYSMTKISDGEIANPIIINPDTLVAMNKPSLVKYSGRLKEGGVLIANKSLIGGPFKQKGLSSINVAMTEMASRTGNAKFANMIAIGVLVKKSKMLCLKNVLSALKEMLKGKEELFLKNKKALETGYKIR